MEKLICALELFIRKINSGKIKNFAFFIFVLTLLASCNSGNGNTDAPQKNELTVGKIERPQSQGFLKADEMCISGFEGDSINIHGLIKNTAPADSYKDVVVKVTYYSDAKEKLDSKEYTIPEVFPPNSDVRVELKVENCKDVNTIGWEVVYAKVEKQI
jgi:hypothetical protein